ncbi:hypothetical protein F2Q69_00007210 [Brassica cretica]|uniref:Uncharacterized protein n=1 Tax=Brassica cretica TaxID=69181 RepID=A0A8S9P3W9_BRACR|nr:hypothetical protein F2Q69_00007210 [Brassica cretica]
MPSLCYSPSIIFIWPTDAPQSMDQYMELDQNRDQTVQNNSAEVRLPSRTAHDDRAVYRLDPLTSGMKLRPNPHPDFRTDRASTRPSQPSRQAKANSRARLDLDREVSQNDRNFSLLVRLVRTECSKDQADGLSLMSDTLMDFYHSDFSKARIIQLSEDLGRISTLLDQATDCPDRPAFVQLHTAATSTWPDESGHQPKSHFDQI